MNAGTIDLPIEKIKAYCAEKPIQRLSLFGSALHGDMHAESDVDLLVEYVPDATIGLRVVRHASEFSAIIGRKVDLLTPSELSPYFREEVVKSARLIYAKE